MKSIGLSFVLLMCLFIACKKNKTTPPPNTNTGNCQLASITYSNNSQVSNWKITYTDSGRIDQMTYSIGNATVYREYSYYNGFINIFPYHITECHTYDGDPSKGANLVTSYWGASGTAFGVLWDTIKSYINGVEQINNRRINLYTYDNQGELIMQIVKEGTIQLDTAFFNWQDGNMISSSTKYLGTTILQNTLQYYTDKPSMTGDHFWVGKLWPGNIGWQLHTKNLLKSSTNDKGVVTPVNYTFDNDGKILQWSSQNSAGNTLVTNQWQCQ